MFDLETDAIIRGTCYLRRMTMNVGQLCQTNPVTVRPLDDLVAVAKIMREKHVGYVVVVEPAVRESSFRPAGVITDRDIVCSVIARDADPKALRANEVMTREPVVALDRESIGEALQKMRRIGVRRLPVVADHGELIGVISLDDIIDELAGELEAVAGSVRSEQLIEHSLRP